jgi:hypothetical protein
MVALAAPAAPPDRGEEGQPMPASAPPTPEAGQAATGSGEDPLPAGTEPPLPPPPAMVAAPPPLRAAPPASPPRPRLAYDRRGGDALFRWSQGLPLSAAEMAFVREGCAWSTARQ